MSASAATDASESFLIGQVCLANAKRDDQLLPLRDRLDRFRALVCSYAKRAAVIAIKEVRPCATGDPESKFVAHSVLRRATSGFELEVAGCFPMNCEPFFAKDGTPQPFNPFYLAQVFNPLKVVCKEMVCHRFNLESDSGIYLVLEGRYVPLDGNGTPQPRKQFSVFSTHFPMGEKAKLELAAKIHRILPVGDNSECFLVGDFNFFKDDPLYGKYTSMMLEQWNDVSGKLATESGEPRFGTFFPFPHDKPPVEIAPPHVDSPNTSKLDYVYVRPTMKHWKVKRCFIVDNPVDALVWDHMPLFAEVEPMAFIN